jgi:hypothetical protein
MSNESSPSIHSSTVPTQGVRLLVSFLLIVHLSALAVAVTSAVPQPLWASSAAQRVFGPYLRTLGLNTSYRVGHSQGTRVDTGWQVTAEARLTDGSTWSHALVSGPGFPQLKRIRDHRLATQLGEITIAEFPDRERQSLLVQGLAQGFVDRFLRDGHQRSDLAGGRMTITLSQRLLQSPEQVERDAPAEITTPYVADVVVLDDGLLVNRRDPAGEVAPAASR